MCGLAGFIAASGKHQHCLPDLGRKRLGPRRTDEACDIGNGCVDLVRQKRIVEVVVEPGFQLGHGNEGPTRKLVKQDVCCNVTHVVNGVKSRRKSYLAPILRGPPPAGPKNGWKLGGAPQVSQKAVSDLSAEAL